MSTQARSPLAVVGVSALFPGSVDRTGFWSDILSGRDLITDVPASHWLVEDYYDADPSAPDKTYAKRGAFLKEVDFDALDWGVPPSILPATDTAQLLALIVAQRVLADAAKGQPETLDRSRLSVILGVTSAQELLASMVSRLQRPVWVKSLREAGVPESEVQSICERISSHYVPWQESTFPGLLGNVVAGRIANRLDLGGTNCVTDAACASTFSALHMAANELYMGDSDMVIVGGVDTMNDIFMYMCFSKTPALSASGDVRPFSDKADGTMLGEGIGMVAIKRLEDAERDGDRVYAVIRGVGSSSDGRSKSVYAPVSAGQSHSITRAYKHAGFDPRTVELVEAHGTGTKAGDAAEFGGLELAFGRGSSAADGETQWCALGSVKSQIGHTKAAAGAAGLVKSVLALHHKTLPPTIKIDRPNPKLNLESGPFYMNTQARPWIRDAAHPRRAGVSSFGFGGSNFHVAVEEYTGTNTPAPRLRSQQRELFVVSGSDGAAVAKAAEQLAAQAEAFGDEDRKAFTWLAASTQAQTKTPATARLALVASSASELASALRSAAERVSGAPDKTFATPSGAHYGLGAQQGKLAMLFPGQGSQYVGMGGDLAMNHSAAIEPWDRYGLKVSDEQGNTLASRVFPRPGFDAEYAAERQRELTATQWAQPAIVTTSLSMLTLVRSLGLSPDMVGGHSLGELTATHAAGVFSADEVVAMARHRGELMAAAAEKPGSMTAVRATIEEVRAALEGSSHAKDLTVANHNSPNQVVLSGATQAIAAIEAELNKADLSCQRLPVATAFHSPIVADACAPMGKWLASIEAQAPSMPVYSNARVTPYAKDQDARKSIADAIAQPVRFVEMIEAMLADGARTFLEVGPGNVLGSLTKRIVKAADVDTNCVNVISLDRKGKEGVGNFLDALARLVAAGVAFDTASLWQEFEATVDPASRKKAKLPVAIAGSNHGRPYPPAEGAAGLPAPNPERTPEPQLAAKVAAAPAHPAPATPSAKTQAPVTAPTPAPVPALAQPQAPVPAAAAPAPVAHVAVAPAAPGLPNAWVDAWQAAQQQTASAHTAFQQAMASSHSAYLQAAQTSLMGLASLSNAGKATQPQALAPQSYAAPQPIVAAPAPVSAQPLAAAPAPQPVAAAPASQPVAAAPASQPAAAAAPPKPAVVAQAPKPTVVAAAPQPVAAAPAAAPGIDLHALMLEVVAEQTGYPAEMLNTGMDLEGDLGIDSIKRVEILSVVQSRAPGMPEVDAGHMGSLRTLGEIVEYMQSLMPNAAETAAPAAAASPAPGIDLHALMLEVVAEQTGYPAEMLNTEMDLEGDLGIDSIKRVEILSVVQSRAPGMPEVDAGHMGSLRTLGEIVEYMQSLMPNGSASPPAASVPAVAAAAPSVDLHALMLEVVAEQTGYPAEMLNTEMDLEGDLGIDSIKRVEILSVVQSRAPGMPEVDAGHMGSLRTLGEIVEYMQSLMPSAAPAAAAATAPAPAAAAAAAPSVDLHALMLEVVAEQTGYPAEMLNTGMDLEGDLGIDSIKRVEILSVVQSRAPGMPEVDAGHMGSLRTLGEIVEYMQSLMPGAAPATSEQATAAAAPGIDLHALMLEVVAEQTGYPAEMLDTGMDLEGDLGIDSIKRVEILSVVQSRAPGMPEVDAGHMGSLRTLGQIVEYMQSLMQGGQPETGSTTTAAPAATAKAAQPDMGRYVTTLVDAPALGLAQLGTFGPNTIYVTDEGTGVAQALVGQLLARGTSAQVVDADAVPASAQALIVLAGLRPLGSRSEAIAVNREAFAAARRVAQSFTDAGGMLVTVGDAGGNFGFGDGPAYSEWASGVSALVKTAAQEWPASSLKAIDLERGDRNAEALATAILAELSAGGPEIEVALDAAGHRGTLKSVRRAPERNEARVSAGEVVVVSGGARGVTAACVKAWAVESKAAFVLLGRTPLAAEPASCRGVYDDAQLKRALLTDAQASGQALTPASLGKLVKGVLANREINDTLMAIEAAGGKARYEAVSVTDREGIARVVDTVRSEWGPIVGVVHGAGVLADKRLAEKTDAQFDLVFDTKIEGLDALLSATAKDPLRVLCAFSSVSARCGNNGQSDYAMANEVLNKVLQAQQRARPECLVKSLGWGPWQGGMVNPALAGHFAELGVPMIPLKVGAKMLVDELTGSEPGAVEIVLGGEPKAEALLFAGTEGRELRMEVRVDQHSHAYLSGHAIEGQAVVPVVLASEWMARMAQAFRPDLDFIALKKVKVLKGIRLDHFKAGGDRFVLRCSTIRNGDGALLSVRVESPEGVPHYRAEALMDTGAQELAGAAPDIHVEAWGSSSPYDGDVLFHSERFRVISNMTGVGQAGARASLSSTFGSAQRTLGAEQANVLAFDGGLQLAVLWANHVLGGANLPTGIDEVRGSLQGLSEAAALDCILVGRENTASRAVSDIIFVDKQGMRVAELRGVENHLRPQPAAQAPGKPAN